jgi:hypothetical protein
VRTATAAAAIGPVASRLSRCSCAHAAGSAGPWYTVARSTVAAAPACPAATCAGAGIASVPAWSAIAVPAAWASVHTSALAPVGPGHWDRQGGRKRHGNCELRSDKGRGPGQGTLQMVDHSVRQS